MPFGRVLRQSFDVLDSLYTGYGEMANFGGRAPPSGRISKEVSNDQVKGNANVCDEKS